MQPATRQFTKRHPPSPNSAVHHMPVVSSLQSQAISLQTSAPLRSQGQPAKGQDHQEKHSHQDHHSHDHEHHSHDHHNHDHDQHDHDHHNHDHYSHDNYNHNHHTLDDHNHDHYHHHHHEDHHHDHDHDHNHDHDHDHDHFHAPHSNNTYANYFESQQPHHHHTHVNPSHYPLPSISSVFSTLNPEQKTIFSVACLQAAIGFFIYWTAGSFGSLSMIAFSYMIVFDAIGLINTFVSTVLELEPAFRSRNIQRPFGAIRLQVVLALASAIYLLFFSIQVSKESLEHLLLPSSHDMENSHTSHPEKAAGITTFLLLFISIALSYIAGVNLQNHETFCKVWRRMPITMQGISYSVINRGRRGAINTLRGNIFTSSVIASGSLVLLATFVIRSPAFDKLVATFEAVLMFYVAGPTATALGKLILQTTPKPLQNGIEGKLRELQQIKGVLSIGRTHFWQNTFGQYVASLELHVAADVDEQEVLQATYQTLRGLIKVGAVNNENMSDGGELSISVIKA